MSSANTRLKHTIHAVLLALSALFTGTAQAVEVTFQPVAPSVYAFIGEKGPRTQDNEGLNANIGLVVMPEGALLIDSGATFQSARQIHQAVRAVTAKPIKWVINTGGQDHRWLGNGYFLAQGAQLIAHANAKADMQARGGDHLTGLRAALGERAEGTVAILPDRLITGNDERLTLGGTVIELRHRGGGHTPGDMMVWLPETKILFSGDIVYVDRLLSVISVSNTLAWLAAFEEIETLQPARIVPGHGDLTTLTTARVQTRDYLQALRVHMKKAVNDGEDVGAAVKRFNAKPWLHLLNAAELQPGNASRAYLELERE